ncbi:MAG: hypothetical protein QOH05_2593, partial [Acetobacteraceae bacterium]|nr:hypothetical protein [Acetobacteraceae bacterium]
MRRRSVFLVGGLVAAGLGLGVGAWREAAAQAAADWIGADVNGMHYEVLLPDHYGNDGHYPVVLYLHQLDMGSYPAGLRKQVNGWFNTYVFRTRHPCIVVV